MDMFILNAPRSIGTDNEIVIVALLLSHIHQITIGVIESLFQLCFDCVLKSQKYKNVLIVRIQQRRRRRPQIEGPSN